MTVQTSHKKDLATTLSALACGLALIASGCASSGNGTSSSRNLITAEDLALSTQNNLLEYLRDDPRIEIAYNGDTGEDEIRLRGRTTRSLSGGSRGVLLVVDGTRRTDAVFAARELRLYEIEQVRILYASEAGARYGTGSAGGVIEVILK